MNMYDKDSEFRKIMLDMVSKLFPDAMDKEMENYPSASFVDDSKYIDIGE